MCVCVHWDLSTLCDCQVCVCDMGSMQFALLMFSHFQAGHTHTLHSVLFLWLGWVYTEECFA